MRGDRPLSKPVYGNTFRFTPHARGSTLITITADRCSLVYPACAGIDRNMIRLLHCILRLPRMRGDRPIVEVLACPVIEFTPHARGSTCGKATNEGYHVVYPACAGIDLVPYPPRSQESSLPRMRGDRPGIIDALASISMFTPHARGSTVYLWLPENAHHVYPACAGIDH